MGNLNGSEPMDDPQPQQRPWGARRGYRNDGEPWWARLVERLGLPTFLLLLFLFFGYKLVIAADLKWTAHNTALVESINGFTLEQKSTTKAVNDLSDELKDHARGFGD